MDRAQSPSKLPTPLCQVDGSNNFSLPSLKQAFQSETEAESSKIMVMLVMTIGPSNLEEEMVVIKAVLERPIREIEEKLQEEKIIRLTRKPKKPQPDPS